VAAKTIARFASSVTPDHAFAPPAIVHALGGHVS
jgi:hypothetical protein